MKVLWVDDDSIALRSWQQMLIEEGHELLKAFNPDEAFAVIRTEGNNIARVILDVMLPAGSTYSGEDTDRGMRTGFLLARDIQRDLPGVPILLLTNLREDTVRSEMQGTTDLQVLIKIHSTPTDVLGWIEQPTSLAVWKGGLRNERRSSAR
jgi:CheY-like chemotaxis protein